MFDKDYVGKGTPKQDNIRIKLSLFINSKVLKTLTFWSFRADTTYGRLYNLYAVNDSRNLCPLGWHIPIDITVNSEFLNLITCLGGDSIAGGKMKETGTTHWNFPNTGATNESGFSGLPGGMRDYAFSCIGDIGYWWSYGVFGSAGVARYLLYNDAYCVNNAIGKYVGLYVRCIKDSSTSQINDINYKDDFEIYPNPVIDKLIIGRNKGQNIKMQINNVIGKCILQRELSNGMNEIDVSFLSNGVYLIRLIGTNSTIQRKLIKE